MKRVAKIKGFFNDSQIYDSGILNKVSGNSFVYENNEKTFWTFILCVSDMESNIYAWIMIVLMRHKLNVPSSMSSEKHIRSLYTLSEQYKDSIRM